MTSSAGMKSIPARSAAIAPCADAGEDVVIGDRDRLHPERAPELDVLLRRRTTVGVVGVAVEIGGDEHAWCLVLVIRTRSAGRSSCPPLLSQTSFRRMREPGA